jgi:hypothetical protein
LPSIVLANCPLLRFLRRREDFIRNMAAPFAAQSFRQAREFFRHAESSSWLVVARRTKT